MCHNNFICCNASKSLLSSISSYFNTNQNDSSNNIKINYSSITSDDELLQLLFHDYHNINGSVLARISILLSKHGIKDLKKRATMRRLLLEKLGKDESKLMKEETDAIRDAAFRDAAKKHLPTREEIAKLPKWKERENVVGSEHGYVRHFQDHEGKLLIAKWDATSESWNSDIKKILQDNFQGVFGKSERGQSSPVDTILEQTTSNGPTLEEIVKLPKWSSNNQFTGIEGQIKIFQMDGQPVISSWNVENETWSKFEEITKSHYNNGYKGFKMDDLIRKSIQYDHALAIGIGHSKSTAENLLIGYNDGDHPLVTAQTVANEYKLEKSHMVVLADSIQRYTGASPPLSYIISGAGSKHINGRYNLNIRENGELWYRKQIPTTEYDPEWDEKKQLVLLRCIMSSTCSAQSNSASSGTKEWFISETDINQPCTENDVDYYNNLSQGKLPQTSAWTICKHCIGRYPLPKFVTGVPLDEQSRMEKGRNRPTPEEISKLPKWKNKYIQVTNSLVGLGKRQVKLFQRGGKVVKAVWRASTQTWSEFAEITEFHYKNGLDGWDVLDLMRKSIQYEHALTYRSEEENVIIGYNYGDDPFVTARRVIDEYKLDSGHMFFHAWNNKYRIADFIREAEEVIKTGVSQTKMSQPNPEAFWISLILVIAIGFIYLYEYGKGSPKKASPIINKMILVKLSATNRLKRNQGRKLKGLINKSGVEDIQIGKKTDQLSVMNKIEASSGVRYVPVHVKGSEEAVQKAVVLIQQAIDKENVDEDIKLPSIDTKQAATSTSNQSLTTTAINTYKKATNYIGKGTVIAVAVLYSVWLMILLLQYQDCSTDKYCQPSFKAAFVGLVLGFLICSAVVLVLRIIAYGLSLINKYTGISKYDFIIVFGSLCFVVMFGIIFGVNGHSEFVAYIFFLGAIILLLWILFDLYQTMKIKQTFYVESTKAKELTKMKEIRIKSSIDMQLYLKIQPAVAGDSYRTMHMSGSRRNVREAIGIIQEAVGKENVSTTKPSSTMSLQESASSKVNSSEAQPIQEESTRETNNNKLAKETASSIGNVPVSEPQPNQKETTTESPVQCETKNYNDNGLTKEATTTKSPPARVVPEEDVPSEIGIGSTQGMTRDTITEASMSSLNDRSNISKSYSNFTLNEDDPLLIFLRSQASCIKGSVDEFYTWLVKSEDIDSMLALKEAVNEDDYLNDMKVGDGGSGIKGFKRKAFLRAISEYFKSDAKPIAEVHHSLPQCQKKNLSDTEDPPEELVCPISLNLMTNDPVVAADGITYERASIEDWFEKSKAKISDAQENLKNKPHSEADQRVVDTGICSPVYGSKLENLTLVSITVVRNMARAYKEKREAGS